MIKITKSNLKRYYDNPAGNLYYFNKQDSLWAAAQGISQAERVNAMNYGVSFVYIPGPVKVVSADNLLTIVLQN